jgi:glycosyltransferase involved in cell wall biosynthesis
LHVLVASIVDPDAARNGAATVTRGWLRALEDGPLRATVTLVALPALSRQGHRVRQAASIATALVSSLPAKVAFARRGALHRAVASELRRRRCDLLLLNGSDLLWLLPMLPPSLPCALVAHNVEHRLFADQARLVARWQPWLRPLLERERRRLEELETAGVRAAGHVAFLSERDRGWGATLAPYTTVVPPLFPPVRPRSGREAGAGARRIGFVGNLDWWPNRDGLGWFLSRVWPRIRAGDLELHLFGKGTERVAGPAEQVVGHGELDDIAVAFDACDAMVIPCFAGGGVSVKLAEAVHHGVPGITSSFAAGGLGLEDGPRLVVSDDPEAWRRWLAGGARRDHDDRPPATRFAIGTHAPAIATFVERAATGSARRVSGGRRA